MTGHRPLTLYAATATPLAGAGAVLDLRGVAELARALERSPVDGVFVGGTTGEGVLLSVEERRRLTESFRAGFTREVIVHCGAQSTADTVALARHALAAGADAVAVIPPPYYPLDEESLVAHLVAAADAADGLPTYLYSFPARSGYPLPLPVVEEVRRRAGNVCGIKASDHDLDAVAAFIDTGLPVLVGVEPLIPAAVGRGAAGAVSGLACVFPELVDRLLRDPEDAIAELVAEAGRRFGSRAFCAAVKHALALRGVAVGGDVRSPLRGLTAREREDVASAVSAVERALPTQPVAGSRSG